MGTCILVFNCNLRDGDLTTMSTLFTAYEYINATEPHVLDLVTNPQTAFIGDTIRAHDVAVEASMPVANDGRYPRLVWMVVFR